MPDSCLTWMPSRSHWPRISCRGIAATKNLAILRVFAPSWWVLGQALPRRREDAKNHEAFFL